MLPNIPNEKGYGYNHYTAFGGVNAQLGAKDGEIADMLNITSDNYPIISTRKQRLVQESEANYKGFIRYNNQNAYVDSDDNDSSDKFVYGTNEHELSSGEERELIPMANRILIFPDKKVYNVANNSMESLESSLGSISVSLPRYGELYGAKAENNTIVYSGQDSSFDFTDYFSVGDAVTLSGFTDEQNNKTPIIRELTATEMRFYEFTFILGVDNYKYTLNGVLSPGYYALRRRDDYVRFQVTADIPAGTVLTCNTNATPSISASPTTTAISNVAIGKEASDTVLTFSEIPADLTGQTISFSRTIPDMDYYCVSNNRLWGCKGDTIYASKLGDPKNFNVFDGLSTDSWSVDTGTQGEFTGCCEYLGYPTFFKEKGIFKVYGDYPQQYALSKHMFNGVKAGCYKSLAVAGDVLFYLSPIGVLAYTGSMPSVIDKPLNHEFDNGVGGTDGTKYYISDDKTYVYDTYYRGWWIEDGIIDRFSMGDELYALIENEENTDLITLTGGTEENVSWEIIFADFYSSTPNNKEIYRLEIMSDTSGIEEDMPTVYYSNDGENWIRWGTMSKGVKHSDVFAIRPDRRKYFAIKIVGYGQIDIYSVTTFVKENMN